jgi:hypothetical protein
MQNTTPSTSISRIAQVHTRSQHSKGSSRSRFGGPDTYVAVTIAPAGVAVPYTLRRDVLAKRGVEIRYFGQGYRQYSGPRSALGQALAAAQRFAESVQ